MWAIPVPRHPFITKQLVKIVQMKLRNLNKMQSFCIQLRKMIQHTLSNSFLCSKNPPCKFTKKSQTPCMALGRKAFRPLPFATRSVPFSANRLPFTVRRYATSAYSAPLLLSALL
jgi:hypothetical protein